MCGLKYRQVRVRASVGASVWVNEPTSSVQDAVAFHNLIAQGLGVECGMWIWIWNGYGMDMGIGLNMDWMDLDMESEMDGRRPNQAVSSEQHRNRQTQ